MLSSLQVLDSRELLRQHILFIFERNPLSNEQVDFILDSYSEPWRHYHNCDHILKMLDILWKTAALSDEDYINSIEIMIVYHDLLLKLGRDPGWSERMSADKAEKDLEQAGYEVGFITLVFGGVHATAHHTLGTVLPQNQNTISVFLDIDILAGLGTSWEEFDGITKQIQREYEPLYTAAEFRDGRAKWAKSFLDRPQIFLSPQFAQHELVARENLQRYIDEA